MKPLRRGMATRRTFEFVDVGPIPQIEQINGTPIGRMYKTPEGKMYASATTIFGHFKKKDLAAWRAHVGHKEADRIRDEAGARGTKLHELAEMYIKGEEMPKKPPKDFTLAHMWQLIRPAINQNVGRVYACETRLYSDLLGVAGTVDLVAEWNGRRSIIDFKSALRKKNESKIDNYYEQTSCYACMWEERTGMPINQIVILIAPKGARLQPIVVYRNDYLRQMISKVQAFQRLHNLECPSEEKLRDLLAYVD